MLKDRHAYKLVNILAKFVGNGSLCNNYLCSILLVISVRAISASFFFVKKVCSARDSAKETMLGNSR